MVLGNYYLSKEKMNALGQGIIFNDLDEINRALENKKVDIHAIVGIRTSAFLAEKFNNMYQDAILITTPGKVIFNNTLPSNFPFTKDIITSHCIPVHKALFKLFVSFI